MLKTLSKLLHQHCALTLFIMCVSVISFGLLSYDFFSMFRTDLILIEQNGAMVMAEHGLGHLFTLLLYGFLGLLSYLVFKACEKILVERLTKL